MGTNSNQFSLKNQLATTAAVGDKAEAYVLAYLKDQLLASPHAHIRTLAEKVKLVSDQGLSYDIEAFDEQGQSILVEVKGTISKKTKGDDFFITAAELDKARTLPNYYVYRVTHLNEAQPQLTILGPTFWQDPDAYELEARQFRVRLR